VTNDPVLIAYAVRDRPGKKSIWTRIGAAWPHDKGAGLTVILNLMPIEPRIVLVEPSYDPPSGGYRAKELAPAAKTRSAGALSVSPKTPRSR
jgi:hypothetical protein